MDKGEEIANRARNALGEYCMNECNAYCCRKGYLILSKSEMKLLTKNKKEKLLKEKNLTELPGKRYSLFLGNPEGCPSLNDTKCLLHKNPNRPLACKEFPIFIEGKQVRISKRCFGAKQGLLYPYIREFIESGYKIV